MMHYTVARIGRAGFADSVCYVHLQAPPKRVTQPRSTLWSPDPKGKSNSDVPQLRPSMQHSMSLRLDAVADSASSTLARAHYSVDLSSWRKADDSAHPVVLPNTPCLCMCQEL